MWRWPSAGPCGRALPFDHIHNASIDIGKPDALPGIINSLANAIRAAKLRSQLTAAAAERLKLFKRRIPKPAHA
jgi:hypothetical protein